jgi:hypothetical protein
LSPDIQRLWEETLEEFRALGGIADNVRLGEGAFGRGLFPCDPSKPVKLHVPESLLIEVGHLHFSEYELRVGPRSPAGAREKAFVEKYQKDFSWGEGRRSTEGVLAIFQSATPELREMLAAPFDLDCWLAAPDPGSVAERYFASRAIRYGTKAVAMPVLELANHGNGPAFRIGDGIGLSGTFDGEILVRYEANADALGVFKSWGFAAPEDAALSVGLGLERAGIVIRRDTDKSRAGQVPFFPEVVVKNGEIRLSFLLLGHKKFPRLARGIFTRIMRDAGRKDAEEVFDLIQHINRTQLCRLFAACEDAPPPLARLLRTLARFQLEAMSHNVGTREL